MKKSNAALITVSTLFLLTTLTLVSTGSAPRVIHFKGHSMEPFFSPGDKGICVPQSSYEQRDVVVFDDPDKRGIDIAHRIIKTTEKGFKTRGDNNDYTDPWKIQNKDIKCQITKVYG